MRSENIQMGNPYTIVYAMYGDRPSMHPWWLKWYGVSIGCFDTKEEAERGIEDHIEELRRYSDEDEDR